MKAGGCLAFLAGIDLSEVAAVYEDEIRYRLHLHDVLGLEQGAVLDRHAGNRAVTALDVDGAMAGEMQNPPAATQDRRKAAAGVGALDTVGHLEALLLQQAGDQPRFLGRPRKRGQFRESGRWIADDQRCFPVDTMDRWGVGPGELADHSGAHRQWLLLVRPGRHSSFHG